MGCGGAIRKGLSKFYPNFCSINLDKTSASRYNVTIAYGSWLRRLSGMRSKR